MDIRYEIDNFEKLLHCIDWSKKREYEVRIVKTKQDNPELETDQLLKTLKVKDPLDFLKLEHLKYWMFAEGARIYIQTDEIIRVTSKPELDTDWEVALFSSITDSNNDCAIKTILKTDTGIDIIPTEGYDIHKIINNNYLMEPRVISFIVNGFALLYMCRYNK